MPAIYRRHNLFMIRTNIKPLSVNRAWKGRRFKTDEYEEYETELFVALLPKNYKVPEGKIEARYVFAFSSEKCDNDNPLKPFQDVLSKMYGFNDNMIYRTIIDKVVVPKGQEYIEWELVPYV